MVNHINYPDSDGNVYCRKENDVVELTNDFMENNCAGCPFFAGSAQGEGVECYFNDRRKDIDNPHIVHNPEAEKDQMIIADILYPETKLTISDDKK